MPDSTTEHAHLIGPRPNTLNELAVGDSGRITELTGDAGASARLMEMGLVPGTVVRVARVAPLGDPIDIVVRGYHLSLRRAEARTIQILQDQATGSP